ATVLLSDKQGGLPDCALDVVVLPAIIALVREISAGQGSPEVCFGHAMRKSIQGIREVHPRAVAAIDGVVSKRGDGLQWRVDSRCGESGPRPVGLHPRGLFHLAPDAGE